MPFREPVLQLHDIIDAIEMIEKFVKGMDFESFRTDPKTVAAVERKLLTIAEAAVRLGQEASALCPDIPWHDIRNMGNWLRHQYDKVDLEIVWTTVHRDLATLKENIRRAVP